MDAKGAGGAGFPMSIERLRPEELARGAAKGVRTKARKRKKDESPARFAAKLLFQFRVMKGGKANVRRLCEERIVVFRAEDQSRAIVEARRRGRAANFRYRGAYGDRVHFEFVGLLDLLELGVECEPDEAWYDLGWRVRPMERRQTIMPARFNRGGRVIGC